MQSSAINQEQTVIDVAAGLLQQPIGDADHFCSGGNSDIYRISSEDNYYALKFYCHRNGLERLEREVEGFRYLHNHGITCVPVTIAADYERHCALFEWIDGSRIDTPDHHHIDSLLEFCERLFHLGRQDSARDLKQASASCFSGQDVIKQLRERLHHLQDSKFWRSKLENFIYIDLFPLLLSLESKAVKQYATKNIRLDESIKHSLRILSPSDFGFHNALSTEDGSFVFLDFEYFGWDDPVKLTADVLLHPAMQLNDGLKHRFLNGMMNLFNKPERAVFQARFQALYPLFGLIWCLIILNVFLPGYGKITGVTTDDYDKALYKAKNLFRRIQEFHEYGRDFI